MTTAITPDQIQPLLRDALTGAITRHLSEITRGWYDACARQGVDLRLGQQVGWNAASGSFVLPGGMMPSSPAPAARAFNAAVERLLPVITKSLVADAAVRGLAVVDATLTWIIELNAFEITTVRYKSG